MITEKELSHSKKERIDGIFEKTCVFRLKS